MKLSEVVRINKDAVLSNCITGALWSGRKYDESLAQAAEYFSTTGGIWVEKDMAYEKVLAYFRAEWNKVYNSADALSKMITRIRKTYIQPSYKTNAEFVRRVFDDDLGSVGELFETLRYVGQI